MAARTAWVLNFDAELELATRGSYTTSPRIQAVIRRMIPRLRGLLGPDDLVLDDGGGEPLDGDDFVGDCWSPTPSALDRLHRLGLPLPPAPPRSVLQRVNHRRFCLELGTALPGAVFVERVEEIPPILEGPGPSGTWLAKRAFGFSGRGLRRLRGRRLEEDDQRWCRKACRPGLGLVLEPWVRREADFVIHGYVERGGDTRLGRPIVQSCDDRGRWLDSELASPGALRPAESTQLEQSALECAGALHAAGYFGPFGIDAFRYLDDRGRARFHPRVEINARYCTGWGLGMGRRGYTGARQRS